MKNIQITGLILIAFLASCDQGQTVKGPSKALKSAIEFHISEKGKAADQYRDMDLYDYQVTITNNWKSPIYLHCSTPRIHSEYIIKRNPEAICYRTMGKGAINLSGRGLSGAGGVKEIKKGEQISFIIPMPVIPGHDQAGDFKIHMTLFLDRNLRQGRTFFSELVSFNPTG